MSVKFFIIVAACMACMIPLAAAQTLPHIQMSSDSDVYGPGQTIYVHGLVAHENGGAVTIRVISPNDGIVAIGQVIPDGRDWSWSLPAEFDMPGRYTILAHYSLVDNPDRYTTATFIYNKAAEGAVLVNGTTYKITYTGDHIISAYTDADTSLIYLEFEGPAAGVMRLPDGLYIGPLVSISGGSITALPDGVYTYSTDDTTLVLAANTVAVPEFGSAAMIVAAVSAGVIPLMRRK